MRSVDQDTWGGMVKQPRNLVLGALVGGGIGLLIVLWNGLTPPAAPSTLLILLPAAFALLGFAAVAGFQGSQPYVFRQVVPVSPAELHRHALRWYAAAGWTLAAAVDGRSGALAFTRHSAPDPLLALVLLVFGILPGVLYLLVGGRTVTTTILIRPAPGGAELEIIASVRADGGQAAAVRFVRSLHRSV